MKIKTVKLVQFGIDPIDKTIIDDHIIETSKKARKSKKKQ